MVVVMMVMLNPLLAVCKSLELMLSSLHHRSPRRVGQGQLSPV